MIPTAGIIKHEQTIGEFAELFKIPFGSPITPGGLNIFKISGQYSQGGPADRWSNAPIEPG